MNLLHLISIEKRKNKGRKNFPILLGFVLFQVFYFSFNESRSMTAHPQGWLNILYYAPLLNSIFLPTILAILGSRHMDMEHRAESFKLLYTFARPKNIFLAKICYGSIQIFAICCIQVAALIGVGKYLLFPPDFPVSYYAWYFISTFIVSEILYLMQSILSFFFANQAVSICTGLAGSLAGTFLLYLPNGPLQRIVPWGLYGCTLSVLMHWDRATRAVDFYQIPFPYKDLFVCLLWLLALTCLAAYCLKKTDIDGNFLTVRGSSGAGQKSKKSGKSSLHYLPAELMKMKGSPAWLALFIIPAISAVIGTVNYTGNIGILTEEWYSLWSQHTLFLDYFFLPVLIGIFISSIWRMEHTGTNWNQIAAHLPASKIILQKFLASLLFNGLTILWIFALFISCGKFVGIQSTLPGKMPEWLFFGFLGSCCVSAIQIFFSLVIRNFVLPIGLAFAGSVSGLLLSAKGFPYLLPYSLLSVGMRANNPHYNLDFKKFFLSFGIWIIFWIGASIIYIRRSDIKTHE